MDGIKRTVENFLYLSVASGWKNLITHFLLSPWSEPKENDGCFYIKAPSSVKEAVPLFRSNKNA